jgi:LacI family transcriptional regulator
MNILTVARRARVSTATVSRVLNHSPRVREETAVKVRRAIKELGYTPNSNARALRSGRSYLYGIIVSDIRNPFFPDLIEHFELLATQHGVDVTVANTGYSEERLLASIQRLLERGIDGIAIFTSEVSEAALQKLHSSRVPTVLLNQPMVSGKLYTIIVDYMRAYVEAVEYLYTLGHRRIGFVAGPVTLSSALARKDAFLAAMKLHHLPFQANWMFDGDHKLSGGMIAAERFFSMKHAPTAILCSNDMMAVGFLQTATSLGHKIPDDVSLIGFDDLFLCEIVHPRMTTIHQPRKDIATWAFYALQSEFSKQKGNSVILPHLVKRGSTGPVPRE